LNCAVISTDARLRARITEALDDRRLGLKLAVTIASPISVLSQDVAEDLRKVAVQLVLLDLNEDPAMGLRFARFLSEEIHGLTFIFVGPEVAPELLLEAMRVGGAEYLRVPVEDADLAAALARATRRLSTTSAPVTDGKEPGHVYAVFSAKGGTGVTTTATNLAVHLRNGTHKSTLLLDLDVEMGGSALMLGLQPRYTFADFARNLHRMDRNLLESLIERHDSGLHLLASPAQPAGETFTKEQVRSALQFLRRHYDHIVIDLARTVTPVTLAALERADDVLLLATPELPTLRNTKKVLPIVQRTVSNESALHVILNRHKASDLIGPKDVREVLGLDVYCTLERDDEYLTLSMNEGTPVVTQPKSRYARDLRALGESLAGPMNGKRSARGLGSLLGLRRTKTAEENA
jgi:pilus assembly protein CpaE